MTEVIESAYKEFQRSLIGFFQDFAEVLEWSVFRDQPGSLRELLCALGVLEVVMDFDDAYTVLWWTLGVEILFCNGFQASLGIVHDLNESTENPVFLF